MRRGFIAVAVLAMSAGVFADILIDDFSSGTDENQLGHKWFYYTNLAIRGGTGNEIINEWENGTLRSKNYGECAPDLWEEIHIPADQKIGTIGTSNYLLRFKPTANSGREASGSNAAVLEFSNLKQVNVPCYPEVGISTNLTSANPDLPINDPDQKPVGDVFNGVTHITFWAKVSHPDMPVKFKVETAEQLRDVEEAGTPGYLAKTKKLAYAPYYKQLKFNAADTWQYFEVAVTGNCNYTSFGGTNPPPSGTNINQCAGDLIRDSWESSIAHAYNFDIKDAVKIAWYVHGQDWQTPDGETASLIIDDVKTKGGVEARLSSLSVSSGTLSPAFNPDVTSYSLTVPYGVSSLTIEAAPILAGAIVTGVGGKSLDVGSNTFDIVVTKLYEERTYTLTVIRQTPAVTFVNYNSSNSIIDDFSSGTDENQMGHKWYYYTNLGDKGGIGNEIINEWNNGTLRSTNYGECAPDLWEEINIPADQKTGTIGTSDYLLRFKPTANSGREASGSNAAVLVFSNLRHANGPCYPGVGMGTNLTSANPDLPVFTDPDQKPVGDAFNGVTHITFWAKVSHPDMPVKFKVETAEQLRDVEEAGTPGDLAKTKKLAYAPYYKQLKFNAADTWQYFEVAVTGSCNYTSFGGTNPPPSGTNINQCAGDLIRDSWESSIAHAYNFDIKDAVRIAWYIHGQDWVSPTGETVKLTVDDIRTKISFIQQSVEPNGKAAEPAAPARPDYIFGGWYYDMAYTIPWNFDTDIVTSDITLYAKWTPVHAVTWNTDGGTPVPTQTTVNHGEEIAEPEEMIKTGYTFSGWYSDKALTAAVTFPIEDVNADITLYARWTINAYNVTWNVNGGTPAPTQTSVNHGGKITVPNEMVRTGYAFSGWYRDAEFTNAWNFDTYVVISDTMLCAKWTVNTYTVTFRGPGGTVLATQTVNYGASAAAPSDPMREGYTFTGWDVSFHNVTSDLTVTALWTANTYTLTFSVAGGSGTLTATVDGVPVKSGSEVHYGQSVVFMAAPASGYRIDAWKLNGVDVSDNETNTFEFSGFSAATVMVEFKSNQTAILSPDRVIPGNIGEKSVDAPPVSTLTSEFTAGPNPVSKSLGKVDFFRQGKLIQNGTLTIFDASGNAIKKIAVSDHKMGSSSKRIVSTWNLTDAKGRPVSEGTYLVKGAVNTIDGKKEKISLLIGVR